eukprot:1137113-Alexandrium_andersonii.AAC.1
MTPCLQLLPPLRHFGSSCPTWQRGGGAASTAADAGPVKLSSLTSGRPTCAPTSMRTLSLIHI